MAKVIFSFDTEDYINPGVDDFTRRICEVFDAHSLTASFMLVAERVRVLVARGRMDVIEALSRHEIGYHSYYHSLHPNVAEYLDEIDDWSRGVAEFLAREHEGVDGLIQSGHPAIRPMLISPGRLQIGDAGVGQHPVQFDIAPAVMRIAYDQLIHAGFERSRGGRVDVGDQEPAPFLGNLRSRSFLPEPDVLSRENPADALHIPVHEDFHDPLLSFWNSAISVVF